MTRCRELFGDESKDYQGEIDRHYAEGPPAGWESSYISSYATMHPFEDFAETWAHYLHICDTIETASEYGLTTVGTIIVVQPVPRRRGRDLDAADRRAEHDQPQHGPRRPLPVRDPGTACSTSSTSWRRWRRSADPAAPSGRREHAVGEHGRAVALALAGDWSPRRRHPRRACQPRTRIVSPGNTTPAKRALKPLTLVGVAAEQLVGDRAQHDAVGAQAVQDRRREAGRLRERRGRRAAGCGRRRAGRAAPAAASRAYDVSQSGARSGSSTVADGPRSPPQPPSPRTKIDDRTVQSASPSADERLALLPDHRGLALVPDVGDPGAQRRRARRSGADRRTVISWLPCTTWRQVDVDSPGRSSGGGSVSWKVGATMPNDGSTCRSSPSSV